MFVPDLLFSVLFDWKFNLETTYLKILELFLTKGSVLSGRCPYLSYPYFSRVAGDWLLTGLRKWRLCRIYRTLELIGDYLFYYKNFLFLIPIPSSIWYIDFSTSLSSATCLSITKFILPVRSVNIWYLWWHVYFIWQKKYCSFNFKIFLSVLPVFRCSYTQWFFVGESDVVSVNGT